MYQADCLLCLCQPSGKQSQLSIVGKRCRTLLSPYESGSEHNNTSHAMALLHTVTKGIGFQSMDGVANAFRDQECCSNRTLQWFINVLLWVSASTCIHIANFNLCLEEDFQIDQCHSHQFYTNIKTQKVLSFLALQVAGELCQSSVDCLE